MSRRLSLIIALAAVVITIAAYIIIRNLPEKPYEPPTRADRYTHLDTLSSNVVYVDFRRGAGDRLTFQRVEKEIDGGTTEIWEVLNPRISFTPKQSAVGDFAFTMSNLFSEQIIEESPSDLSIYGLDDPLGVLTVRTKDDQEVVIRIGALSPTGVSHYAQVNDDETVYTLRKYTVDRVFSDVDDLRERMIAMPNTQAIDYLRLVREGRTIELVPKSSDSEFELAAASSLKMVQPYRQARPIDLQRFQEMIETIPPSLSIAGFIDDTPRDLSVYGLDPPRYEFEMRDTEEASIHLLFGNEEDGNFAYAKLADEPLVFTLPKQAVEFLQTTPFKLAEKFMLIVNIDYVDSFTITGPETTHVARIDRTDFDEETSEGTAYYLDDVEVDEKGFKKFYQAVIGLITDAENPAPKPLGTPDVSVVYELNNKVSTARARLDLVSVDRNFYAAYRSGISEFLVSDYQVKGMFTAARGLLESASKE